MRWRDVKQNRIVKKSPLEQKSASIPKRAKAFLIDMFMINMPILYIAVYLVLGGKDEFLQNHAAIFACTMLFGLIVSVLLCKFAQTPGYKAYEIKLIDANTHKAVGFFKCFFRFLCFIVSGFTLIGLLLCFFREDGKNLHDLLSKTVVIDTENIK
ncbi:MAG: RDD family protein [Campylobacteraceae bacterium]|nr:RDD family protein [Campylobacteraceae bacterium]